MFAETNPARCCITSSVAFSSILMSLSWLLGSTLTSVMTSLSFEICVISLILSSNLKSLVLYLLRTWYYPYHCWTSFPLSLNKLAAEVSIKDLIRSDRAYGMELIKHQNVPHRWSEFLPKLSESYCIIACKLTKTYWFVTCDLLNYRRYCWRIACSKNFK